jgi:hypothetical protein
MTRLLSYLGRFLELRLRAFVYACCGMVGFILGVITTYNLTLAILAAHS